MPEIPTLAELEAILASPIEPKIIQKPDGSLMAIDPDEEPPKFYVSQAQPRPLEELLNPPMTYTYVTLELSQEAYEEVATKLRAAGYSHAFNGTTIDMHGLAIIPSQDPDKID